MLSASLNKTLLPSFQCHIFLSIRAAAVFSPYICFNLAHRTLTGNTMIQYSATLKHCSADLHINTDKREILIYQIHVLLLNIIVSVFLVVLTIRLMLEVTWPAFLSP